MTLNIPLFDGYRILSDKYQYILAREQYGRCISEGYFPKISDLIDSFLQKRLRDSNCVSLQEFKEEINTLLARLHTALADTEIRVSVKKRGDKPNEP